MVVGVGGDGDCRGDGADGGYGCRGGGGGGGSVRDDVGDGCGVWIAR